MQTDPNYLNPNIGVPAYADFGKRLVAHIIDAIIISIPLWILFAIFGVGMGTMMGMGAGGSYDENDAAVAASAMMGTMFLVYIIWFVVVAGYYAYFESSDKQATLGKQVMGIKVSSINGGKITFVNALGRVAVKLFISGICLIGYLMALFTEKKQALHDMVASTLVVNK